MEEHERRLAYAAEHTYVVRPPKRSLATFWHDVGQVLPGHGAFLRGRGGVGPTGPRRLCAKAAVRSERPQVVTPSFLVRQEGFGDAGARVH